MTIKQTSDGAAVVDTELHWIPISEVPPPSGKLLLINQKLGVAMLGNYTHWPHGRWGCARSVTLGPDGALVAYFESALSMWIKWGYGRGGDAELHRAMDFAAWAHSRLCGMPNEQN